jgi:hypothetical protein
LESVRIISIYRRDNKCFVISLVFNILQFNLQNQYFKDNPMKNILSLFIQNICISMLNLWSIFYYNLVHFKTYSNDIYE